MVQKISLATIAIAISASTARDADGLKLQYHPCWAEDRYAARPLQLLEGEPRMTAAAEAEQLQRVHRDKLVANFDDLLNCGPIKAREYLLASHWHLENAINRYLEIQIYFNEVKPIRLREEKVAQLMNFGCELEAARTYLEATNWNLETAKQLFQHEQDTRKLANGPPSSSTRTGGSVSLLRSGAVASEVASMLRVALSATRPRSQRVRRDAFRSLRRRFAMRRHEVRVAPETATDKDDEVEDRALRV